MVRLRIVKEATTTATAIIVTLPGTVTVPKRVLLKLGAAVDFLPRKFNVPALFAHFVRFENQFTVNATAAVVRIKAAFRTATATTSAATSTAAAAATTASTVIIRNMPRPIVVLPVIAA